MSVSASIKKVRPWHEALLEFILANPRASVEETAFHFNVTPAWVSTVKNSDAFQELWAKRRGEHFSRVSSSLSEKLTALAENTVDALSDELEKKRRKNEVDVQTLKEVGEMALKSLGFGNKGVMTPMPQVNIQQNFVVDRETLARARENKMKLISTTNGSENSPVPQIEGSVNAEGV